MDDVLKEKSYAFALRIIKLSQYLRKEHNEYVLSKQILRSGTSVGALVREAGYAQSKKDFINKLSIALKEASETEYWIMLLKDASYITSRMFDSVRPEIIDLLKLLTASIKTTKENLND